MVDIYENHMLQKCFTVSLYFTTDNGCSIIIDNVAINLLRQHPFLMHGALAVAAVHDRYLGVAPHHRRSLRESYHISRCTSLFNTWLNQPITEEHKDPIWSAASTLSILTFSPNNASGLDKAWPLGAPNPSDLAWLRLSTGKMKLWHMVDPLREGSVYRPMFKTLGRLRQILPVRGTEGLVDELAMLCGIDEQSSLQTNPYFAVAHAFSYFFKLPSETAIWGELLMVASHMHNGFAVLLHNRDPVALFLLCLWYNRARGCKWWINFRARHEIPAILKYLQQYHKDETAIQNLIQKYGITSAS